MDEFDGGEIARIFHIRIVSLKRNRSVIWFAPGSASKNYLAGYLRKCPVRLSTSLDRVMKSVGLPEQNETPGTSSNFAMVAIACTEDMISCCKLGWGVSRIDPGGGGHRVNDSGR